MNKVKRCLTKGNVEYIHRVPALSHSDSNGNRLLQTDVTSFFISKPQSRITMVSGRPFDSKWEFNHSQFKLISDISMFGTNMPIDMCVFSKACVLHMLPILISNSIFSNFLCTCYLTTLTDRQNWVVFLLARSHCPSVFLI